MRTPQKQQTQWDAKQAGEYEPACATQMDLLPVLQDNYAGDGNRYQDRERGSRVQWNAEGEQRNGDQRLAKPECGANYRGNKQDD
jgi:hypothetical protein